MRRTRLRLSALLITSLATFVACSTGPSQTEPNGLGPDASAGSEWPGDPCGLLVNDDFTSLTNNYTQSSSESYNLGSATFSPECHFSLQGNGSSAEVGVFVDRTSDYELQKSVFQGTPVSSLGLSAWQGDAGGKGNSTIGVLLENWSFRVDATYEYGYPDLMSLATAIAARLK